MEKTHLSLQYRTKSEKHLHGRGEDVERRAKREAVTETPPRTWRRQVLKKIRDLFPGNTSTDVEKTDYLRQAGIRCEKHLHGRGEDTDEPPIILDAWETPPRTWRRQVPLADSSSFWRNTSTDVEKTCQLTWEPNQQQKHLHGRGEDSVVRMESGTLAETPPRTWRRPNAVFEAVCRAGNTSTDVEKTARFSVMLIQPTLLFVVVVVKGGSLTN